MKTLRVALLLISLILASTSVAAQGRGRGTPDGITPAQETSSEGSPCDDYTGKAKGICVAYHEALDCDYELKDGCELLADNFERLTGTSLTLSASSIACPCFADLSQVGFTENSICNVGEESADISEFHGDAGTMTLLRAQAGVTSSFSYCDLVNGAPVIQRLDLNREEGLACISQISNTCASLH